MSFDQFSPELLIEVLGHLLDIPSKIRLERVNRRFRDCIRNVESWKYNTTLRMSRFDSKEELRAFLGHTKAVTKLELDSSAIPPNYFSTLFMFSNKLKVAHFCYDLNVDQLTDCPKHVESLACCLGKVSNTLQIAYIDCCGNRECPVLETLVGQLPFCPKLQKLNLGYVGDDEDAAAEVEQVNNEFMLDSLRNLTLNKLSLVNFCSTINGERLAAVCNTAKDYCLSAITIKRYLIYPPDSMRFQLAQFCQALEPGAARAIKRMKLRYIDCGWIELLPTLPAIFPNLSSLKIMHIPTYPTAEVVAKISEALGDFLHNSAQHKGPLHLEITFTCQQLDEQQDQSFGQLLWHSVNLIDAWRSGTKRTADMQHWKRTLCHGNVTVSIELQ